MNKTDTFITSVTAVKQLVLEYCCRHLNNLSVRIFLLQIKLKKLRFFHLDKTQILVLTTAFTAYHLK